jgi:predicted acyl esterase
MSVLSRVFGVRPARPYPVRVERDVVIPAADGVRLLADRFFPVGVQRAPLVLLRSPYGRGAALDRMPQLLAERGYQVLYQSLRGTDGSGGAFNGFTIHPADADGTLSWLRDQPWFGGELATWGASYLGFAQWELAAREIPEWRIAVIQDAPSEFAHQFMYPGGGFALGNALGWVQLVNRMFRADGAVIPQLLGAFTASRTLREAARTLPVADTDLALTGHRVPWFQEWITHGPDDPYWRATDHRANVERMPPVVHLQGGWYDFFLRGMLADHAALLAAGRRVRLLIGPWTHGRVCSPGSACATRSPRWTPPSTARRPRPGCGCSSPARSGGWTCPAGPRRARPPPGTCTPAAASTGSRRRPVRRRPAGSATTPPTPPRRSPGPWWRSAPGPPTTGGWRPGPTSSPSPPSRSPPTWR